MNGVKCSYAKLNNDVVYIKNAIKGVNYSCPDCDTPMFPKQGEIREWHFSHFASESNCGGEGWLHFNFKMAFSRYLNTFWEVEEVLLEQHVSHNGTEYIPDILLKLYGRDYIIEIAHHHFVEHQKYSDIGLYLFEISLKGMDALVMEAINEFENGIEPQLFKIFKNDFFKFVKLGPIERTVIYNQKLNTLIESSPQTRSKCLRCGKKFIPKKSFYRYCTYKCYRNESNSEW